jgi:hypothetical protein
VILPSLVFPGQTLVEGSPIKAQKEPLDDLVPSSDFLVLHCLGIGSSVLGIGSYCIRKYMSKN